MKVTLTTNINIHKPKTPYERFYADFWKRNFREKEVEQDQFWLAWKKEHRALGVLWDDDIYDKYKFEVDWNEQKYMLFCLKWT